MISAHPHHPVDFPAFIECAAVIVAALVIGWFLIPMMVGALS